MIDINIEELMCKDDKIDAGVQDGYDFTMETLIKEMIENYLTNSSNEYLLKRKVEWLKTTIDEKYSQYK